MKRVHKTVHHLYSFWRILIQQNVQFWLAESLDERIFRK